VSPSGGFRLRRGVVEQLAARRMPLGCCFFYNMDVQGGGRVLNIN
jgi:hypothetical protein